MGLGCVIHMKSKWWLDSSARSRWEWSLKVWEEGLSLSMRAVGSHGVFKRERER